MELRPTGVFYHPSFSKKSYLTWGNRLRDFPEALNPLLSKYENLVVITSPPVSKELLLEVHTPRLINAVMRNPLCNTAWESAGGVVLAGEMVYTSKLKNAFCFIGAGGHHASRDSTWGACCFNDVVLCIKNLRNKYGKVKVAILDVDAHHGDGTRSLILDDKDTLHFCICYFNWQSSDGTKVDVSYEGLSPSEYIEIIDERYRKVCRSFKPDIMFFYFGHDTHIGDYGDIGLSIADYEKMTEIVIDIAQETCNGKLVVVLAGGSIPEVARDSSLMIIQKLCSST